MVSCISDCEGSGQGRIHSYADSRVVSIGISGNGGIAFVSRIYASSHILFLSKCIVCLLLELKEQSDVRAVASGDVPTSPLVGTAPFSVPLD